MERPSKIILFLALLFALLSTGAYGVALAAPDLRVASAVEALAGHPLGIAGLHPAESGAGIKAGVSGAELAASDSASGSTAIPGIDESSGSGVSSGQDLEDSQGEDVDEQGSQNSDDSVDENQDEEQSDDQSVNDDQGENEDQNDDQSEDQYQDDDGGDSGAVGIYAGLMTQWKLQS